MINMVKLPTNKSSLFLRVAKGHFATSHSHINYYIDVTTQKARLSEAKLSPRSWWLPISTAPSWTPCSVWTHAGHRHLSGQRADQRRFANMNAHQTIYVITPSTPAAARSSSATISPRWSRASTSSSCRPPSPPATPCRRPSRRSTTTAAPWRACRPSSPLPTSVWASGHLHLRPSSLPDYASFDSRDCPMCKAGQHIDALVNSFGYSASESEIFLPLSPRCAAAWRGVLL